MKEKKRRRGLSIMLELVVLVKPLLHMILLAVLLGTIGHLCAISLTIIGAELLLYGAGRVESLWFGMTGKQLFIFLLIIAVARGILHYAEQYCNHFIAFKLLEIIRHKVFAALRRLCPAKLEGKDRGNLISIITADIELLEVFYAHTISPIAIAILTDGLMTVFIARFHPLSGLLAFAAYLIVGLAIPLYNGKKTCDKGMEFRTEMGELNSFVLDSLRGMDEILQYGQGENRKKQMDERARHLSFLQQQLSRREGEQRAFTNLAVWLASFGMLFLNMQLYQRGGMGFADMVLVTIAMMGSFGPVIALSSLSNNLNQTLASGERVLTLLREQPQVAEILPGAELNWNGSRHFTGAKMSHVDFSYDNSEEQILSDYHIQIEPGQITGLHGASGSGKSTVLKLLMRFWEPQRGEITLSDRRISEIPTCQLRGVESYVTQETHLFHDTIAHNIAIGKTGASREEVMEAAKKAAIHEFILSLPEGYDTQVGELGDTLSGGERQRIGIARAFLHDAPFLLLDEPTSNLDALNEAMIVKTLKESCHGKTVVLVSHRLSTLRIADRIFEMDRIR